MSLVDFGQYARGADSRGDLYRVEENPEIEKTELFNLRKRCGQVLGYIPQVEVDEIPRLAKVLFPLQIGNERKRLYKEKIVNMPLHEGGQYPVKVSISGEWSWLSPNVKPTLKSDEDFFISFEPQAVGAGEQMSSISFRIDQNRAVMSASGVTGKLDMGDYKMTNLLLDEFERW